MRRLLFVSATRARDELVITAQFYSTESQNGAPVFNMFLQDAFKAAEKQFNPNAVKYDQP
jgi:superfamily I DNA/RNA helicase